MQAVAKLTLILSADPAIVRITAGQSADAGRLRPAGNDCAPPDSGHRGLALGKNLVYGCDRIVSRLPNGVRVITGGDYSLIAE